VVWVDRVKTTPLNKSKPKGFILKTKTAQKISVSFSLDPEVYEQIRVLAEKENQKVSGLLRKIISVVMESFRE